jgi:hypothetical protein
MMRSRLRLAAILSAALVVVAGLLVPWVGEAESLRPAVSPAEDQPATELDGPRGERAPRRDGLGAPSPSPRSLTVRLLDATLAEPLLGSVLDSRGALLGETGDDGRARIVLRTGTTSALQFRAEGYEPHRAEPPAENPPGEWTVHLEPSLVTTVETVTPSGAPLEGIEVRVAPSSRFDSKGTWRALPPPANLQWLAGRTGPDGRWTFPLAVRALGEVRSPGGGVTRVKLVPGETARVTIAPGVATLRFVDAVSGAPLPGFVVQTRDALDPRQGPLYRETDALARLQVNPGSTELIVELPDPSRRNATCEADPRVTRMGEGYAFRFSGLLAGDTIELRVERCSVEVQLVDALSGEPVAGRVEVQYENSYTDPGLGPIWSPSMRLRSEFELVEGSFALGCAYLTNSPRRRLRLEVPGYGPAWVRHDGLQKNGPTVTVPLQPGQKTVLLRVVYADGSPFLGTLAVRDDGSGSLTPRMLTSPEGRLEPLPWSGEDLTVFVFSNAAPGPAAFQAAPTHPYGGTARHLLGRVEAGDVREGACTLTLDFTPPHGSLTVRGVPPGGPVLLALDVDGARHRASDRIGAEVRFTDLPPGPYLVGTEGWIAGLVSQGLVPGQDPGQDPGQALVTAVEPGRESYVDWDPRWWLETPLEGRVLCPPDMLSELALRPWYGGRTGSVQPRDTLRIYLDPEGNYHIPAGEPRPEVLLVCTANSSYWIQVLQAFEPGQDTEVPLGRLTLEWEGSPPSGENVTVLYWATELDFDTEFIDDRPNGYYLEWNTRSPLVLNAVSTSVRDVRLDVDKDRRIAFPVTIREAADTRLSVRRGGGTPVPLGR